MSSNNDSAIITSRKQSHFDLCATQPVEFTTTTTMLEDVTLVPHSLSSTQFESIDLTTQFMGKQLRAPLMITGMSGGTENTGKFNRELAAVAEQYGLAFGVGSQRVMLRNPAARESFQLRDVAPTALILGNIGIAQARELTEQQLRCLVSDISADGLCIHLNTPMELVQEAGDHDFRGSLDAIKRCVQIFGERLMIKETGCGVDYQTAEALAGVGIKYIDVAGAGGTSWVKVEALRNRAQRQLGTALAEWGIPTAASLCEVRRVAGVQYVGSGGIRTGTDVAKVLTLGATLAGIALPIMRAWVSGGRTAAAQYVEDLLLELRAVTMLCGCSKTSELALQHPVIDGRLREWCMSRGCGVSG
jgi:isopentenyl-diphosphate delta-isomerase